MKKQTSNVTDATQQNTGAEIPAQPAASGSSTPGRSRNRGGGSDAPRRSPSKRTPSTARGGSTIMKKGLGVGAYAGLGTFIAQARAQGLNNQAILHEVGLYCDNFAVS